MLALYPECHYAECRYAKCLYAEYRGAGTLPKMILISFVNTSRAFSDDFEELAGAVTVPRHSAQ
jgi:hypothetical protein